MSGTTRFPGRTMLIAVLAPALVTMLAIIAGCNREQPAAAQSQKAQQQTAAQTSAEQPQATVVATEQKTCPVMEGNPIDKNIFVEYKGKKVYFCCKACPAKFLADPEKYISKLPQFKN
ncbi:MAG: YHS domain-containing protein [Phycisphaerales bacterium]